jgi:hypothetical protein
MTNLSPAAQMTDQHPITPPPELVQQWWESTIPGIETSIKDQLRTQAARWGADQELEACCEWVNDDLAYDVADRLRAARRPKPPSLKEQALKTLDGLTLPDDAFETIRFALEALDD